MPTRRRRAFIRRALIAASAAASWQPRTAPAEQPSPATKATRRIERLYRPANVDTNSRLCMASSVAGHKRAFGSDTVPGCYEDLDEADLLVLVGSNAAWCHPVLYQRMLVNKQKRGARMVVIDPRRTDTVGDDDLFLGLKPGTDTAPFRRLLVQLADNGVLDRDYI